MSVPNGADVPTPTYKITIDGDGVKVAKEIDADVATEILGIVMGGASASSGGTTRSTRSKPKRTPARTKTGSSTKPARKKSGSPSLVRDLVMRPKAKTSFVDFAAEKAPKTMQQKNVVSVYWLAKFGGVASGITVDHVNTCFVEAKWPRPSNLENALQVTAGRKGWLETSDMSNITLTTRGEDEVQFNLPPPAKKK